MILQTDSSIGENNNLNSDESQDSADEQNIKKLFMKVKMDHKLTQKAFDEVIKVNQYALQTIIGSLKNKVYSAMKHQSTSPELYHEIYSLFDNSINCHDNFQSAFLQNKFVSADFPYVVRLCVCIGLIPCNCTIW